MNSREVLVELAARLDRPQAELQKGWREAMLILRRGFDKGRGFTLTRFGPWRVRECKTPCFSSPAKTLPAVTAENAFDFPAGQTAARNPQWQEVACKTI